MVDPRPVCLVESIGDLDTISSGVWGNGKPEEMGDREARILPLQVPCITKNWMPSCCPTS